jgi:hypothetical protein
MTTRLFNAVCRLGDDLAAGDCPLLQNADRGYVRERLGRSHVRLAECSGTGAEEVQRPEHIRAQPHRDGMHRCEPALGSLRGELWPSTRLGRKVGNEHGRAGGDALQAGTLVDLQLEKLQEPGLLTGGGQHPHATSLIGEKQSSSGHLQ